MLTECESECHPTASENPTKENIAKAKHILDDLRNAISETRTESFTEKMKVGFACKQGIRSIFSPLAVLSLV